MNGNPTDTALDEVTPFFLAQGKVLPQHYDAAIRLTEQIKGVLKQAARSFIEAGAKLEKASAGQAWRILGRSSWHEYCELDLHISDSLAYDLVKLNRLIIQYPHLAERVEEIGVGNMRLLLPHLDYDREEHKFEAKPEKVTQLIEDAEQLTWNDLRQKLNGDSPPPREIRPVPTTPSTEPNEKPCMNCALTNRMIAVSQLADQWDAEADALSGRGETAAALNLRQCVMELREAVTE